MIEQNMGLVTNIAKGFNPKSQNELEELIQAGRIALWKVSKTYDKTKGEFSSYAYRAIVRDILKEKKFINKFNFEPLHENMSVATKEEPDFNQYSLSNIQKKILYYRQSNYTWKEIAELMSLTIYFVKQHYKEAIEQIRNAERET